MLASVLVLSAMLAEPAEPRPSMSITDFGFEDSNRGWLLLSGLDGNGDGRFELRRTADGGQTWSVAGVAAGLPSGAVFADARNGWVFGRRGLMSTHDGGRTWTDDALGPIEAVAASGGSVWALRASDLPNGFRYIEILESPVDRSEWKSIATQPPVVPREREPRALIKSGQRAWLLVNGDFQDTENTTRGRLLFTADGGRSWQRLANPCPMDSDALRLVSIPGTEHGLALACGSDEAESPFTVAVLRSTDLGRSWTEVGTLPYLRGLHDFAASSPNRVWIGSRYSPVALGPTGLMVPHYDAPSYEPHATGSFGQIHFADERRGWMAYEEPGATHLLRTTDGGETWRPLCVDQAEGFVRERSVQHVSGVRLTSLDCAPFRVSGGQTIKCRGRLNAAPPRPVVVAVESYSWPPEQVSVEAESFDFDVWAPRLERDQDLEISIGFEGQEAAGDCHVPVERAVRIKLTRSAEIVPAPTPVPKCSDDVRISREQAEDRQRRWEVNTEFRVDPRSGKHLPMVLRGHRADSAAMGIVPDFVHWTFFFRGCIAICSMWQEVRDGRIVGVLAGSEPSDHSVGLLAVSSRYADSGLLAGPTEFLRSPAGRGPLEIQSAQGDRLRIVSNDGKAWTFDVPSRRWIPDERALKPAPLPAPGS